MATPTLAAPPAPWTSLRLAGARAWRALTEPSADVTEPEEARRARLLASVLLPLVPLGILGSAFAPWLIAGAPAPLATPASLVGGVASLLAAVAYVLARTRHHGLAAVVVVVVTAVAACAAFVANHGRATAGLEISFVAVSLILSGLLLPVWATLALGGTLLAVLVALPVAVEGLDAPLVIVPVLFVAMLTVLVGVSAATRQAETRSRKEAVDALLGSEHRYRSLVDHAPDGIMVLCDGVVVYANPAALALFAAQRPEDLLGRHADDLLEPAYRAKIAERMRAIQGGASTTPLEIQIRRLDGSVLDVDTMGAPTTFQGRPADQTMLRDISARKEAQRANDLARERLNEIERLQEINAVKTTLLNTASHELNTPIAALRLQLHMLKKGEEEADPRRRKALQLLDRNVDRLALLVQDVLDVARMQSGQLQVRRERVDLREAAREAVDFYEGPARNGGLELVLDLPVEATVDADPMRVAQVLHNLLSNAIKFTPGGGVVRVEVAREGAEAVLTVRDTGRGLRADQVARLFQPFSQVHDTHREAKGGTGLGLHICRGILESHGGRIWVESDGEGRGSAFRFALPLAGRPVKGSSVAAEWS